MHEALLQLAVPHSMTETYPIDDEDNVYLICTVHEDRPLPRRFINYNFEQLTTDKIWPDAFYANLSLAELLLDYSLENIKHLSSRGIVAHFLPLGWSPCMEYTEYENWQKWRDFLFLGWMNSRRYNILQPLRDHYLLTPEKILIANNYWGDEHRRICMTAKVGLNIHYYTGKTILEVLRIIPLIANGVLVVSEKSDDPWYDRTYGDIISFCNPGDNFAQKCLDTLALYKSDEPARRYRCLVRDHKFVDHVAKILPLINNGFIASS